MPGRSWKPVLRAPLAPLFALTLLFGVRVAYAAAPDSLAADTLVRVAPDAPLAVTRVVKGDEAFPVTLGSFTTTLSGSRPERTANIRLAAEALDGVVVAPGEELSFNAIVGPRSAERGYQNAPVILHEERQLQLGGGVCQVASTLFVAGLLSGLGVHERWRHSSPVDYIPLGEDATIAWGAKDLKLRNDLSQSVRVRVSLLGSTLNVRLEGEEPLAAHYELGTEERELPAQSAATGARAGREIELYRMVRTAAGGASREYVHRDVYPPTYGRRGEP